MKKRIKKKGRPRIRKEDLPEPPGLMIRRHYRKIGVVPGWPRKRFEQLCAISNYLPEELAALCAITPKQLESMMNKNKFTPPVSLHLAMIEGVIHEVKLKRKWEPVVPIQLLSKP